MTQLGQSALGNANFHAQRGEGFGSVAGQVCVKVHGRGLAILNDPRKDECLDRRNDAHWPLRYHGPMPRAKPISIPTHDWYLAQWLSTCGKEQADLEKDLEWNKSKASLMLRGKQRYHRDDINEVAAWLNLQPYELLMHPSDAMAIRQLRIDARRVAVAGPPFEVLANDVTDKLRVADGHQTYIAMPEAPDDGRTKKRVGGKRK